MPYGHRHGVVRSSYRKIDGEEILRRVEAEGVTVQLRARRDRPVLDAAALRRRQAWPCRAAGRSLVGGSAAAVQDIERVETGAGWEFIQI